MSDTILLNFQDGVARITLNRPDHLNSFNEAMHRALREALKTLQRSRDVRVVLITGAGRGFCAGQDLSDRQVAPDNAVSDLGASLDRNYNPLIRTLRSLRMPIVCAVNGVAAGAGANLALACDIVLAARSASFVQAFCNIGLIPDSGGTWVLPRLVGTARALGLSLLGEKLPAQQAADWGLIWACVDDDQLMDRADALVRHLVRQPTKGLALTKRAIYAATNQNLDKQLDLERDYQREAGRSEDYREGVAAFLEKREPRFKGR